MKAFEFVITVVGIDPFETEGLFDRLYEDGFDDATISKTDGKVLFDFSREGATYADALASAVVALGKVGASVIAIERLPEDDSGIEAFDIGAFETATEIAASRLASFRLGLDAEDPDAYNEDELLRAGLIVGSILASFTITPIQGDKLN
jgi:hypothetical protein